MESLAATAIHNLYSFSIMIGVVVYLVVGVIVMRVQYSAAGVDLIPNKAFWKSLPGLIKVII